MIYVTLDCETLCLADEVDGGFGNPGAMGLTVMAIKYCVPPTGARRYGIYIPDTDVTDFLRSDHEFYTPASKSLNGDPFCQLKTKGMMVRILDNADRIISFNGVKFDYGVLGGAGFDTAGWIEKSYDIATEFYSATNNKFRVSLDDLAARTLGEKKVLDGREAVWLWRSGKYLLDRIREEGEQKVWGIGARYLIKSVIDYCIDDVRKTEKIYEHIMMHRGLVYYLDKRAHRVKPLRLQLPAGETSIPEGSE